LLFHLKNVERKMKGDVLTVPKTAHNLPHFMTDEVGKTLLWGRSLDEYKLMFRLSETDMKSKILGCGVGPASFNAADFL
jgi:hypothetical protein